MSQAVKRYCPVCQFVVNPVDHESRCRLSSLNPSVETKELLRKRAWIGDEIHKLDVKQVLLLRDIPVKELESEFQKYASNQAQAQYLKTYCVQLPDYLGSSDHSLATWFEANYYGRFRELYLQRVFTPFPDRPVHPDILVFSQSVDLSH